MSRCTLIAELATSHGGDLDLAGDMIRAAADAGADYVKFQSYSLARLNPSDSQASWLRQAHLDREDHERLIRICGECQVQFLSTPFDPDSLQMLRDLGLKTFKIASSESSSGWWSAQTGEQWYVSYPWGRVPFNDTYTQVPAERRVFTYLTAIPLYPTPLECVGQATLLDGWSDHGEGLAACYWALAQGVQVLEVHVAMPGRSRVMPFDKSMQELRELRKFADQMATLNTGVATQYRERWSA